MGLPFHPPVERLEHAYVRLRDAAPDLPPGLEAVTCCHACIDGGDVTEALVWGPDAVQRVRAAFPDAQEVARVLDPDWLRQCILVAAGSPDAEPPGMVAIRALRAPENEWHMVSHPGAPSAPDILQRMSRLFDTV